MKREKYFSQSLTYKKPKHKKPRLNANITNYVEWWIAEGVVLGRLWGGGRGFYAARRVKANNFEELNNKILKELDEGGLDSGMGFQELIVAPMVVTKHLSITVNSKKYKIKCAGFHSQETIDTFIFGDKKSLTDNELEQCYKSLEYYLLESESYNGETIT